MLAHKIQESCSVMMWALMSLEIVKGYLLARKKQEMNSVDWLALKSQENCLVIEFLQE